MTESQRYWSEEITDADRHDVAGGIFATGSAREIAEAVIAEASEDGEKPQRRTPCGDRRSEPTRPRQALKGLLTESPLNCSTVLPVFGSTV